MNIKLGTYLQQVRKKSNLTLRDVESVIGISNAYLSQIENNKIVKPSPNVLYKLASLYKLSYEYLMELSGYPILQHQNQISHKLDQSFKDLTEDEKREVFDFVSYIKSKRQES